MCAMRTQPVPQHPHSPTPPAVLQDPGARRAMWAFIQRATQPRGGAQVAVALTTHSMEECEALCGRVGILAAGHLRCLASPTRLKALYCHQYILEVRALPALRLGCQRPGL